VIVERLFLLCSSILAIFRLMPDLTDSLTSAEPRDLADAIAFSLGFEGRKRVQRQAGGFTVSRPQLSRRANALAFAPSSRLPTARSIPLGRLTPEG
jgi:hypothetical protein